ncbi:MAG: nucleoside monophosphate kinase [bacterium]|nr:nucleoside monophosphate kinase [bacterium]
MKDSKKIKVIIILGPPGSGKGTQAGLLAERFDFFHFETSEIIEKKFENIKRGDFVRVDGERYFLWKEREIRNSGKWMSPPLISFWVKSKIKQLARERKGIILSGSPKTLYEARQMVPLLKNLFGISNVIAILIKQELKTSIWRNKHRKICELMRHPILYSKENAKLRNCPIDGSKLIQREDSNPEVVKSKFLEYKERIMPIITYFKKQGIKTREVNGGQAVIGVLKDILKAIK